MKEGGGKRCEERVPSKGAVPPTATLACKLSSGGLSYAAIVRLPTVQGE